MEYCANILDYIEVTLKPLISEYWFAILLVLCCALHFLSWISVREPVDSDYTPDERRFGTSILVQGSSIGVTAVSILVPAAVLILQLAIKSSNVPAKCQFAFSKNALIDCGSSEVVAVRLSSIIFHSGAGIALFLSSLGFGLFVIVTAPLKSYRVDPRYSPLFGIPYGFQFILLFFGILSIARAIGSII